MINEQQGFTLIEFLVAIVILMVGLLGLLQVINVAVDQNLGNVFRNEAVTVVDEKMMEKKAKAFISLSTGTGPRTSTVQRNVRGIDKAYSVTELITDVTPSSKQITIDARWTKKGANFIHSATSVVSTN